MGAIFFITRLPAFMSGEKNAVGEQAQDVAGQGMGFLDAGGRLRLDAEGQGGDFFQPSSRPGEPDCVQAHLVRDLDSLEDVFRITAGADAQGDIALKAKGTNLLGEDLIEMVIIADAGNDRRVGCQGNGRQRPPFNFKTVYEFRSNMLRIRRTAAVAEQHDFFACRYAIRHQGRCLDQGIQMAANKPILYSDTLR